MDEVRIICEEKVVSRSLIDCVPVSDLCDESSSADSIDWWQKASSRTRRAGLRSGSRRERANSSVSIEAFKPRSDVKTRSLAELLEDMLRKLVDSRLLGCSMLGTR